MEKIKKTYIVDEKKVKRDEMQRQLREIWEAMKKMDDRERNVLVGIARGLAE